MLNKFDGEISPPNGLTSNYVSAFDVRSRRSIEDKNKFRGHLKEVRQPFEKMVEAGSGLLGVYAGSECTGIALAHEGAIGNASVWMESTSW